MIKVTERPKLSVLFFTYNHQNFIENALKSALSQSLTGYELIISDDFSTDNTRAIIETVLQKNVRKDITIKLNFNFKNKGLITTVNEAMYLAKGEIFVLMSGDDISKQHRLEKTLKIFQHSADIQLVWGEAIRIDINGEPLYTPRINSTYTIFSYSTWTKNIYAGSYPFGASAAFRSNLFNIFGPMQEGQHGEDNCYWVRALLLGKIYFQSEHFVYWRIHNGSISNHVGDFKNEVWRSRHLAWMEKHANFMPQWRADIIKAYDLNLISWIRKTNLIFISKRENATWSLAASSLKAEPWTVWWQKAFRLLILFRTCTVLRFLKVRISQRCRDRLWIFWAKKKSCRAV